MKMNLPNNICTILLSRLINSEPLIVRWRQLPPERSSPSPETKYTASSPTGVVPTFYKKIKFFNYQRIPVNIDQLFQYGVPVPTHPIVDYESSSVADPDPGSDSFTTP
jgi:hypothetical protein